jgi:hypothetical protein
MGAVLVYDVTYKESFNKVESLIIAFAGWKMDRRAKRIRQ